MVRIAFDIGGALSKYPEIFRDLIRCLPLDSVFVISDMHPKEKILEVLRLNAFTVAEENVHSADYETYGEGCKAVLLEELKIDMLFDDHMAYLMEGCPVRCLVMPDIRQPYYADTWKQPDGEPLFGRRTYSKRQVKGRDA